MKLLMNQLHTYCILNVQLTKIMFQSKGPYLLKILANKQNVEVKKGSKKCSKFKCHHHKRGNTDSKSKHEECSKIQPLLDILQEIADHVHNNALENK